MLPIRGEISIAPMMTAVEPVFKPTEAMIIAQIITHMLVPVTLPPDSSRSRMTSFEALSSDNENIVPISVFMPMVLLRFML